jgi:excinuclease ABC subunit C
MDIKEKIKNLPDSCGVYIMMDAQNKVLYIGKATSIKKRVYQHFRGGSIYGKSLVFIEKVKNIDYILCDTEEQALILEATLIKEKKPKYNVALKDDKSYPYVLVTDEVFPRIYICRPTKITKKGKLFGPFTNIKLLRKALNLIRKIFPYCSCKKPRRGCLYYHLNLCPGPQITAISPSEYQENIINICKILSGERKELIEKLQAQMEEKVKKEKFEEAAIIRDKLFAIYALYSGKRQVNELLILKEILNLKKIPFLIEAIDISSFSGKEATGSVVVFKDGLPFKSGYRRYRIKEVNEIDDYKMIREVVRRRYRRLKNERGSFPDLIIIDGGAGHLNVAKEELEKLELNIPIISVAKKNEEIYVSEEKKLVIPKDNPGLHFIQRIRNEAHRFAHKYHTLLRKKKIENK